MSILADATTITWSSLSSVIDAVTSQISTTNILGVLAGAIGISIGFVFMWWGIRKGVRMILDAAKSGKQKQ